MKISIITICFNAAETIEKTILSVINQNYKQLEYIIIDGGSTDSTMDIVNKHKSKIQKIISEKDKGLYDALNKGLNLASGDVIAFLHADDVYANNEVLEKYANVFSVTHADAVYADLVYISQEKPDKIVRKWISGKYKPGAFMNGWMPPHPTLFIRKRVFEKYGNFNSSFTSSGDYELMLRFIHKFKINLAYLNELTVSMRVGGKSNKSLKNRLIANKEDRLAWRINDLKPRPYTRYLKPFRKLLQFRKSNMSK
ncbi:MAG: glycosyltransferase [Sphingobacteriaceae bacterium]|nr:glycosyltransferase [Sphingobacteriaceae bacterium]